MKLLLYCTKSKPYMTIADVMHNDQNFHTEYATLFNYSKEDAVRCFGELYNGKVVAECDFEVEEFVNPYFPKGSFVTHSITYEKFLEQSCLTENELKKYINNGNRGYAIHIENLNIFDEPRELKTLYQYSHYNTCIKNTPKNMMNCYDADGEHKILISFHPEGLCKILNGEKTIEIRKKVLKEMLK